MFNIDMFYDSSSRILHGLFCFFCFFVSCSSLFRSAVGAHTKQLMSTMFSQAIQSLLKSIDALIRDLVTKVEALGESVSKGLFTVYSVCWEGASLVQIDTAVQAQIRQCRDSLLPSFSKLRNELDQTMEAIGIEREQPDVDVLGIHGADERLRAAVANDEVMNLCSDSDEEEDLTMPQPKTFTIYPKTLENVSQGLGLRITSRACGLFVITHCETFSPCQGVVNWIFYSCGSFGKIHAGTDMNALITSIDEMNKNKKPYELVFIREEDIGNMEKWENRYQKKSSSSSSTSIIGSKRVASSTESASSSLSSSQDLEAPAKKQRNVL